MGLAVDIGVNQGAISRELELNRGFLRLSVFTGAPFCGAKRLSKEESGASDDALPHRTGGDITTRQSVEPSANLRCTQPRRRHKSQL